MPQLAVVIPTLLDSDALGRLLADLPPDPAVEVVVVDAGADPDIERMAGSRPGLKVIHAPPGRGAQLNAGARACSADLILFLHADSKLPSGWQERLRTLPPETGGGWFRFALDDDAWQARIIERLVAVRIALFRLPYGDQGIFVRRSVFDRLGGYPDWPLMEDVEFVRRLVTLAPVVEVPLPLRTSSRRWRRDGWFRRSARNLMLLSLFFVGVSPRQLARWYSGT